MKSSHLFILFILLVTISCSNRGKKDYSYPVEQYQELGLPGIDRPWDVSEFGDVIGNLRDVKHKDLYALPKKGSKKSGRLFDHMLSMDHFSFLQNDTIPISDKAYRMPPFLQLHNEYVDIYTDPYHREQYYHKELIELYIFGIRITQEMLNLAYRINESDAPDAAKMQSGFHAIQNIHVTMLADALNNQTFTSLYDTKGLETLGDSIASSVRKNRSWFHPLHVDKIKQNMQAVMDSTTSEKIRKEYAEIINSF